MDLVYVRVPARLLDLGLRDRTAGRRLAQGVPPVTLAPDEALEDIDLGRSERSLYRILGSQDGRDYWATPDDPGDWVERALLGAHRFPHGCDESVYGPSLYLAPTEVVAIADRLERLDEAGFRARYAQYVARHGRLRPDLDDDGLETRLVPSYARLRRFYLEARQHGQAVIITPT